MGVKSKLDQSNDLVVETLVNMLSAGIDRRFQSVLSDNPACKPLADRCRNSAIRPQAAGASGSRTECARRSTPSVDWFSRQRFAVGSLGWCRVYWATPVGVGAYVGSKDEWRHFCFEFVLFDVVVIHNSILEVWSQQVNRCLSLLSLFIIGVNFATDWSKHDLVNGVWSLNVCKRETPI